MILDCVAPPATKMDASLPQPTSPMNSEEQKRYLLRFLRAALRQLMIYRTFAELTKRNAGSHVAEVNYLLETIRSEPSLATQLGPDFETFVEDLLGGSEGDVDQALESFLTNWFPKTPSN